MDKKYGDMAFKDVGGNPRTLIRSLRAASNWVHLNGSYRILDGLFHGDSTSGAVTEEIQFAREVLPPHLFQKWISEQNPRKPATTFTEDDLDLCLALKFEFDAAVKEAITEENEQEYWKSQCADVVRIMATNKVQSLSCRLLEQFLTTPNMMNYFLEESFPSLLPALGVTIPQLNALEAAISLVRAQQQALELAKSWPDVVSSGTEIPQVLVEDHALACN